MMFNSSEQELFHAPLISTLKRLELWLERDGASRIIVVEPTIRAVKAQRLPEHIKVLFKKRQGTRKMVRGRRYHGEARPTLAVWPDDNLDEGAVPMLACCMSGAVDFNIADYILKINAGDWIIFPPGIPKQDGNASHFEGDSAGRSGDVLWMRPTVRRFSGLSLWACRSEADEHSKLEDHRCWLGNRFLAQVFDEFCEEMQYERRPEVAQRLLSLILFLMRTEVSAGNTSREPVRVHHTGPNEELSFIAEALSYIDENLYRHLTIDKVARRVAVSPATFTRYFKEETGETFGQYQTRRRLETAEQLLKTTNLTVLHICQRIGLQYSQMRKLFQEKHGCSPTEYRERES